MVFRMEVIYDEIVDILAVKDLAGSTIGYTLLPGIFEVSDTNLMTKSLFPNNVEVIFTYDDIKQRSNLTTIKTKMFTKNPFFSTILGFTQSRPRPLVDIERFIQLLPGTYRSEKPNNISGTDKNSFKSRLRGWFDCGRCMTSCFIQFCIR